MADLNMPNLNKKSNKYIFKNKLTLRRKSKRKLLSEALFMLILSLLLVYLNYLIPNKTLLFNNFLGYFEKSLLVLGELFFYFYQIFLVIFITLSLVFSLILFIGSFYRIFKVIKRKTKQISYK